MFCGARSLRICGVHSPAAACSPRAGIYRAQSLAAGDGVAVRGATACRPRRTASNNGQPVLDFPAPARILTSSPAGCCWPGAPAGNKLPQHPLHGASCAASRLSLGNTVPLAAADRSSVYGGSGERRCGGLAEWGSLGRRRSCPQLACCTAACCCASGNGSQPRASILAELKVPRASSTGKAARCPERCCAHV
jgi:hypothetical protein